MTNFNVSIVSDTVCPWCYVGKRKLESAIATYRTSSPSASASDTFNVSWLPFYLNPDAPKAGIDKQVSYNRKFGPERTQMIQRMLQGAGNETGINFKFGGKTGNTRDSHRLIQLAKTKGDEVQNKVVDQLFAAYFENEQDITSHDVLRKAGLAAGIDETEVNEWLKSDRGGKEVDEEVMEAQQNVITGVPHFTINGFEVGGAQDPRAFVKIFERIKEKDGAAQHERL